MSDPARVRRTADVVLADHGVPSVLVDNAGRDIDMPFLEMTDEAWDVVVRSYLSGVPPGRFLGE